VKKKLIGFTLTLILVFSIGVVAYGDPIGGGVDPPMCPIGMSACLGFNFPFESK